MNGDIQTAYPTTSAVREYARIALRLAKVTNQNLLWDKMNFPLFILLLSAIAAIIAWCMMPEPLPPAQGSWFEPRYEERNGN